MHFWKYQGAGNDFVMLDQREIQGITRQDTETVARLCDRHFGVGADGLIVLQKHAERGYEMIYFNSDGRESTMCGNGGRCFAAFAHDLGIAGDQFEFMAIDGPHEALIRKTDSASAWVDLKMIDVRQVERLDDNTFVLNTGSPHYVRFVADTSSIDVARAGAEVRYSARFAGEGINVNFVEKTPEGGLRVRTYERGVEGETLACGTGVTASAIAAFLHSSTADDHAEYAIEALGGALSVRFNQKGDALTDIWLCGPAVRVFEGELEN